LNRSVFLTKESDRHLSLPGKTVEPRGRLERPSLVYETSTSPAMLTRHGAEGDA
jgi:hypothetical protein